MPGVIRLLSEHTINQIAAGEVIENPASVVKELVENSIDAGATKIIVETTGGGLQKICISDDGVGMNSTDLLLCLERHATSKIVQAEDLAHVSTMGFRGEALASIAAISKMTITTCQASSVGSQVDVESGIIGAVKPCARNQGTSIEVKQLFYNVPARRKFQKSPALCSVDILKALTQLSLANPMISFELYDNQQERLKLIRGEGDFLDALKKRTAQVLGDSFLEESVAVHATFDPFSFKGILGGVQNTRPNRALQYCFINQRAVQCPALSYAVKDAFGTRIGHDRFPIYVLHLDIPSAFLDVNVHPQKKEVRLREEKWIKEKLKEQIQEEIFVKEKSMASSSLSSAPLSLNMFSPKSFFAKPKNNKEDYGFIETFSDFPQKESVQKEWDVFEPPQRELFSKNEEVDGQIPLFVEKKVVPIGVYQHYLWINAASSNYLEMGFPSEGVLIVDLKAASARLLFESLQEDLQDSQQTLLLPLSFSCSLAEAQLLLVNEKELEKMGFSLRSIGKQSFLVEAIPSLLPEEEALEFLKIAFSAEKGESWGLKKERILASACNRLLSQRKENYGIGQALEIFYSLIKAKIPLFCPLGNKTIVSLENNELDQLFAKKR
jgi:DNA mismatch repair protein MutL